MPANQSTCTSSSARPSSSAAAPGLKNTPESPSPAPEPALPIAARRALGPASVKAPTVVRVLVGAGETGPRGMLEGGATVGATRGGEVDPGNVRPLKPGTAEARAASVRPAG